MTELAEIFKAMREKSREIRWRRAEKNLEYLQDAVDRSRIEPFEIPGDGSIVLFRTPGRIKATFWPTKNKWSDDTNGRIYRGGARNFVCWYRKINGVTNVHGIEVDPIRAPARAPATVTDIQDGVATKNKKAATAAAKKKKKLVIETEEEVD